MNLLNSSSSEMVSVTGVTMGVMGSVSLGLRGFGGMGAVGGWGTLLFLGIRGNSAENRFLYAALNVGYSSRRFASCRECCRCACQISDSPRCIGTRSTGRLVHGPQHSALITLSHSQTASCTAGSVDA